MNAREESVAIQTSTKNLAVMKFCHFEVVTSLTRQDTVSPFWSCTRPILNSKERIVISLKLCLYDMQRKE